MYQLEPEVFILTEKSTYSVYYWMHFCIILNKIKFKIQVQESFISHRYLQPIKPPCVYFTLSETETASWYLIRTGRNYCESVITWLIQNPQKKTSLHFVVLLSSLTDNETFVKKYRQVFGRWTHERLMTNECYGIKKTACSYPCFSFLSDIVSWHCHSHRLLINT